MDVVKLGQIGLEIVQRHYPKVNVQNQAAVLRYGQRILMPGGQKPNVPLLEQIDEAVVFHMEQCPKCKESDPPATPGPG